SRQQSAEDLDFIETAAVIGGVAVPAGSLLLAHGFDSQLYVLDPATGAILVGPLAIPPSSTGATADVEGVAFDPGRNSIWVVHANDDEIDELDLNGVFLQGFPSTPAGSPLFGVFSGDIDVDAGTGNLLLDSSGASSDFIRELTPTGALVRDIDTAGVHGPSGPSGLALQDDHPGEG